MEETDPEQSKTETASGENIPESPAEPETDEIAGKPDGGNNGLAIVLSAVAFVATAVAVTELIIIMRRKKK